MPLPACLRFPPLDVWASAASASPLPLPLRGGRGTCLEYAAGPGCLPGGDGEAPGTSGDTAMAVERWRSWMRRGRGRQVLVAMRSCGVGGCEGQRARPGSGWGAGFRGVGGMAQAGQGLRSAFIPDDQLNRRGVVRRPAEGKGVEVVAEYGSIVPRRWR